MFIRAYLYHHIHFFNINNRRTYQCIRQHKVYGSHNGFQIYNDNDYNNKNIRDICLFVHW